MTAVPAERTVAPAPTRLGNVVHIHLANPLPTLVLPWLITLAVFLLNFAIWLMVAQAAGGVEHLEPDAFVYNGGVSWIVFFMLVVAVQAMNLTFPFALGFAVTRRDFYLGSSMYFAGLALMYSTGLTALAALERVTDGWGMGAGFFAPYGLHDNPLWELWVVYLGTMLLFFFLGGAVATVWVRWKAYGLYAFFIGLAVVLVAAAWIVTVTESWGSIGHYLVTTSPVVLVAWTVPVTALCGVLGYLFLRRATPKG